MNEYKRADLNPEKWIVGSPILHRRGVTQKNSYRIEDSQMPSAVLQRPEPSMDALEIGKLGPIVQTRHRCSHSRMETV
ncbi:hypothetical protein BK120_33370 [Paenibacillus sp. FSL A5-0031]|nr:hypothetical protein BK120_33370 [Paenibacillus sp. FSL A5-0031]